MLKLYSALDREITEFKPTNPEQVNMYYCGPTVYWTQHIGNMRAFFVMDSINRVLQYNGYNVNSIMNVTDVGHMTSDQDEGDDKMVVASKREHKSPEEIANHYLGLCLADMKKLNILTPTHIEKATNVIPEIIEFIEKLIENGYAYLTSSGVYYDISKYADYGKLGGVNQEDKIMGARIEINPEKRNPADFALWVIAPKEHIMKWPSPWGEGYPGWHIECSAICRKFCGDNVDIHGGGVEHKPVHHENEIAQNYGLTKTNVVKRWLHHEHLMVDGGKMSKSLGNVWAVSSLEEQGFRPLDLRYFFLNAHFSKQQNFTIDELKSCNTALTRLYKQVIEHKNAEEKDIDLSSLEEKFLSAVNDNLNLPLALSVVWEAIKEDKNKKIYDLLLKFDLALGLDIENAEKHLEQKEDEIPAEIKELAEERWQAKKEKNFAKADEIRSKLTELGYSVKDSASGFEIIKN